MDGEADQDTTMRQAACSAFALGWNVGEAGSVLHAGQSGADTSPSLPLTAELSTEERLEQLVRRVQARLRVLGPALVADESRESLTTARDAFVATPGRAPLRTLHTTLLSVLLAEDSRLGKAYSLGLTLWELSAPPDSGQPAEWYAAEQANRAKHYLSDLHTILPEHAAMGVLGSLLMWEMHASTLTRREAVTLAQQGRTWRALLSGEKSATDDLGILDYVDAGRRALQSGKAVSGRILRSVLAGDGLAVGLLALVLVVGGLAVAWAANDAGGEVGGGVLALLSGAGGLGFVKKGWDSVSGVWDRARAALMDAALDITIAAAITQLPTREDTAGLRASVQERLHPTGLTPR